MNRRNIKLLFAAQGLLLLLNGCATPKNTSEALTLDTRLYHKESSCKSTKHEELKNTCTEGLQEHEVLEAEKQFYPSWTASDSADYRPELAISLSGGGQRAASTALGFLAGLDSTGVLAKADLLSTVSGGSYAAYWLMTKLYGPKKNAQSKKDLINYSKGSGRFASLFDRYYIFCRTDPLCHSKAKCEKETEMDEYCDLRDGPAPLEPIDLTKDSAAERGGQWGRFQQHVAYHGNLLTSNQASDDFKKLSVWLEFATRSLIVFPSIPLHWAAAGLFDAKINNNYLAHVYRYGIEHEYGLYPNVRGANAVEEFDNAYAISPWMPWLPLRLESEDMALSELTIRSSDDSESEPPIPFWIINSTAAYGGGWKFLKPWDFEGVDGALASFSKNLYDTVYEFTPIARGSASYGYFPNDAHNDLFCGRFDNDDRFLTVSQHQFFTAPKPLKLSEIVAISGAAIDNLDVGGNIALDMFNLGLGQYINNPAQPDEVRRRRQMLPFPLYLLNPRVKHDIHGPSIYLTDGGHSGDNLGIYSALKRRPKHLIVLDAEHESNPDGLAVFESLQQVICRLQVERKVKFDFSSEFREVQNLITSLNKIGKTCTSGDKDKNKARGASPQEINFNVRKVAMPYFKATITVPCVTENKEAFGVPCPSSVSDTVTEMIYAKLALDDEKFLPGYDLRNTCREGGRYQCEVQLFDVKHEKNKGKKLHRGKWSSILLGYPYPHQGTDDFNFSKGQFAAYRALGFDLGKCFVYSNGDTDRSLGIKTDAECSLIASR